MELTISSKVYRFIGVTDERDTCDCCGKTGLKRTVILRHADSGEYVFFGTTCAAKASGWKATRVESAAKQAEAERRAAYNTALRNHPAMVQHDSEVNAANAANIPFKERPLAHWRELRAAAIATIDAQFAI